MTIGANEENKGRHGLGEARSRGIMAVATKTYGVGIIGTGRISGAHAHAEEFMAPNVKARQLIEAGEAGAPVMAADEWYKAFAIQGRPAWFLDREQGGGMWLMNGAHMIDRLTYVLDSRVAAVKAFVGT